MAKKRVDPIPEQFADYDEAAEFWDTHDTTDYLDQFRTLEVTAEFRGRRFEIEIEESVAKALQAKAKTRGVTADRLASELLRRQLDLAA